MKYEIYELYPSARHAYIAIGLAVKTSRPQYFNELSGTARKAIPELTKIGKSLSLSKL